MSVKITFSKGGTGEQTLPLNKIAVPDLWHIAEYVYRTTENSKARDSVLECWRQAHGLLDAWRDTGEELLAIVKEIEREYVCMNRKLSSEVKMHNRIKAAIAKAEGDAR